MVQENTIECNENANESIEVTNVELTEDIVIKYRGIMNKLNKNNSLGKSCRAYKLNAKRYEAAISAINKLPINKMDRKSRKIIELALKIFNESMEAEAFGCISLIGKLEVL